MATKFYEESNVTGNNFIKFIKENRLEDVGGQKVLHLVCFLMKHIQMKLNTFSPMKAKSR